MQTDIHPGNIVVRWESKSRRWRLYLSGTRRLVRNGWGTAADGGGHATESLALKQARAIRHSMRHRKTNITITDPHPTKN